MNKTETQSGFSLEPLIRRPRHSWFWSDDSEDTGWWGPYKTIEQAARECASAGNERIFIASGFKLKKAEQYDYFEWEVNARNAFEIILPTKRTNEPGNVPCRNPDCPKKTGIDQFFVTGNGVRTRSGCWCEVKANDRTERPGQ